MPLPLQDTSLSIINYVYYPAFYLLTYMYCYLVAFCVYLNVALWIKSIRLFFSVLNFY